VIAGFVLRRMPALTDELVATLSQWVFRLGIPLVLFLSAVRVDYRHLLLANYLLAAVLATLVVVAAASLYARWRGYSLEDSTLLVQASYRSNLGIIGIALCAAAYGSEGLALAALPVAVGTILYNLIAVTLLNRAYGKGQSAGALLSGIVRNPLIMGISLGVAISLAGWELPAVVTRVGGGITTTILPLSLMLIGASLNIKSLRASSVLTLEATLWKLLVAPVLSVAIAVAMGVHGAELGVLFLLLASPVAVASYIMVMAAGGNGPLAADMVVSTTLFSSITLTLGLTLLQYLGLV